MSAVIDVVIPSYHPDPRLLSILERLSRQELPVRRVHLINTEAAGLDEMLRQQRTGREELLERYPFLKIIDIARTEFDHGGTRNRGVRQCLSDQPPAQFCVMMTQDALPADAQLIGELIRPLLEDQTLAVTFARQLPNRDAGVAERISRSFNYPAQSRTKSQEDFAELGIKTYFCSNVCAAYRLETWQQLGGFPEHTIFNEDMIYAGRALQQGYRIRYCADAQVIHSHNYNARTQFHRNFDLGVSQAQFPEIFANSHSEGEGVRYVKAVVKTMREEHRTAEIPGFVFTCASRLLGYRLGKYYERLPRAWVRCFSSNKAYWKEPNESCDAKTHFDK